MNDLEGIKEVEGEVTGDIDRARQAADANIAKIKAKEKQMIQKGVEKAKAKIEKEIRETEMKAREDTKKIIADGGKQVRKIQNLAAKNEDDAIKIIVKELRGD